MPALPKSKQLQQEGHRSGEPELDPKADPKVDPTVDPKDKPKDKPATSSPLSKLPSELLRMITNLVFDSIVLSYKDRDQQGRVDSDPYHSTLAETSPHPLALLHVCRHIRSEIELSWLQRVLFYFESPDAMLRILRGVKQRAGVWRMPYKNLSEIRRIRVHVCKWFPHRSTQFASLPDALRKLNAWQNLQLDTLMVEQCRREAFCADVEALFESCSSGWRELHLFAEEGRDRWAAERVWRSAYFLEKSLLERDGAESGSSVTVYRAANSSQEALPKVPHYGGSWPRDDELVRQYGPDQEWVGKPNGRPGFLVVLKRGPRVELNFRRT